MKPKLHKRKSLEIQKRVSYSLEQKIPVIDYIMDVANISPTDKIFYEAYKKYGARNHTWQDFKSMFNGDVNLMQRTISKGWKTWSEINRLSFIFYEYQNDLLNLMEKHNIESIDDDNKDSIREQHPELVALYDKMLYYFDASCPNYSTFNPKVSKLIKEFQKKSEAISTQKSNNKEFIKLFTEYVYKLDKFVDLRNADFVVGERIQTYTDIIKNNPIILGLISNFDSLYPETKLGLAKRILLKSAKVQGTQNCDLIGNNNQDTLNENIYTVATYNDIDRLFMFNTKCPEFHDLDCYLTILVHEDGHRIDYCNPDYGIIGDQLMSFFSENYLNDDVISEKLYFQEATEQSSYYIGKPIKIALVKAIQDNKISLTRAVVCELKNRLYSKIQQRLTK